jgi:hypothetical protein
LESDFYEAWEAEHLPTKCMGAESLIRGFQAMFELRREAHADESPVERVRMRFSALTWSVTGMVLPRIGAHRLTTLVSADGWRRLAWELSGLARHRRFDVGGGGLGSTSL